MTQIFQPHAVLEPARPFLRWAGGKRQLVSSLFSRLPADIAKRRYVEPFLGAGSLYFAVRPEKALLADANSTLIATYSQVRLAPRSVLSALRKLIANHSKEFYYATRDLYNREADSPDQAARFIYLNKTCFNGIFRVNRQGVFNVPKGSKDVLAVPSIEEFTAISNLLRSATLEASDYKKVLAKARPSWFVYLDPPYPALNETAYFDHYTVDRFGEQAQQELAEVCKRLHNLGAYFLMSNADLPEIRGLYSAFAIETIPVRRYVSCKGQRLQVSELLVKNY